MARPRKENYSKFTIYLNKDLHKKVVKQVADNEIAKIDDETLDLPTTISALVEQSVEFYLEAQKKKGKK